MPTLTTANRTQLRNDLSRYFSADELDTLCTDLGEDYDVVPGRNEGELVRAREIIAYFESRGRIEELIAWCAKQRPDLNWQARLIPDSAFTNTARPANQPKPNRAGFPSTLFTIFILVVICAGIVLVGGTLNAVRQASQPAVQRDNPTSGVPTPSNPATMIVANTAAPTSTPAVIATPTPESTSVVAPVVPPAAPTNTPTAPPTINISASPGISALPRVIVDREGVTHVFWVDNTFRRANGFDVLHRERRPDGTWSDAENFTRDFESVSPYQLVAMPTPSGDICVFFHGQNDAIVASKQGLYMRCKRRPDEWQLPQFVQEIRSGYWFPAFAPDASIHVMRAIPGGYCPQIDGVELADGFGNCSNQVFLIDAANNYHVAWVQTESPGPYSVRYRSSSDGGKTWQAEQKINDEASGALSLRGILDRQGRLTLIWLNFAGGQAVMRQWTKEAGWGSIVSLKDFKIPMPQNLTIDHQNLVHGVGYGRLSQVFYFAQQGDGNWGNRQIDSKKDGLDAMSLALDVQDGRHIVWARDKDIFYAFIPPGQ